MGRSAITAVQRRQLRRVVLDWFQDQGIDISGLEVDMSIRARPPEVVIMTDFTASKLNRDGKKRKRPVKATKDPLTDDDWRVILSLPWNETQMARLEQLKSRGNDGFVPADFAGEWSDWESHCKMRYLAASLNRVLLKSGLMYRCTYAPEGDFRSGAYKMRKCKYQ